MKEEYWTTRDGRRISVGEMTESHAKNALRLVIRKMREYQVESKDLTDEINSCFGCWDWWK